MREVNYFKSFLLLCTLIVFTGCVNKHGISLKYYSDCEEYYDLQGYYHKKCGEDDIITYKKMGEHVDTSVKYLDATVDYIEGKTDTITIEDKEKQNKNVW